MSSYRVGPEVITLPMIFALFCFTVIPLAGGAYGLWGMSIKPWLGWKSAQDWVPVPCVIEENWIEGVHPPDGGEPYSQEHFRYVYSFEGKRYAASAWHAMGIQDEVGDRWKRQQRYPQDSQQTCYVNPRNPAQAVLDRSWDNNIWGGLFPLVMFLFGVFCVGLLVFTAGGRSISARGAETDWKPKSALISNGPLRQHESQARQALPWFAVSALVLLMPAYFLYYYFTNEMPTAEIWAMGFLGAFIALLALLMLIKALRLVMGSLRSRPKLLLHPAALTPGEAATLRWTFAGAPKRLQRFRIWLEGREEIEFYRNKQTVKESEIFERLLILDTRSPDDAREGIATFAVPQRSMHSFETHCTRIVWSIRLAMEAGGHADILDEYRVQILPAGEALK